MITFLSVSANKVKVEKTVDNNLTVYRVYYPDGVESSEQFIDEILYNKHIFITPGTIFGSQGEGYIRFSLCVTADKIKEAIARFQPTTDN